MAMSPGTIVGGYRIIRKLGAGGMGSVYLAAHPSLPRTDALKILSPELSRDPEFRARFEREANLAAGLDHPNIVSVYNRGEEHGQLWIAMQFVEGTDAAAELARDPHAMTPLRALRIITEMGKGLDFAHHRGLLHRDVKPANFLLSDTYGDDERVLLTDFGVAKSADDASELTQTGSFLATIAYAPPEQLSGGQLDHRADIYSLACSFFKLLTGQNPYPATQPAMVMMGHLHEPVPRPTSVRPGLPPAIDQVFARAMAKNPHERYLTCREFTDAAAAALMPGAQHPGPHTSPTYPIQTPPQWTNQAPTAPVAPTPNTGAAPKNSRHKVLLAAGALIAVVAVAVGVGVWAAGDDPPPSTQAGTSAAPSPAALSPLEQARQDNPDFAGKTVLMVDVDAENTVATYLGGTLQTKFLEDLGFVYNFNYTKTGDEPSPRPVENSYSRFDTPDDSYILAVRSDEKAGGGGLLGLPFQITGSRATVIPIDDPITVSSIRTWTASSEQTLLSRLLPVLQSRVK
ncbi:serine/threonine-protein kinase [Nocardia rhizosphaerae]|uniref:non-specific serine/threonine protein kinase n=1 Tax=Nocardia rhizosphaerae TaxID=1691571 RepID=A0ABV8L214_9NOCA